MVQIMPTVQLGQALGSGKCGINMDKESIRNKQITSSLSLLLTLPRHGSTISIIQRTNHLSTTHNSYFSFLFLITFYYAYFVPII